MFHILAKNFVIGSYNLLKISKMLKSRKKGKSKLLEGDSSKKLKVSRGTKRKAEDSSQEPTLKKPKIDAS